ncbi:MAG: TIGR02597 family protein [Lentimonas sp.]
MKNYMNPTFILAGAMLTASSYLSAGDTVPVATDPVGYVTTTTPSGDDSVIGLSLARATAFTSAVDSVTGAEVFVTVTLTADAYNNTHYALATSGANAGQWSEIVDTGESSITTAEVLLAATDTFDVVPFWTLATAFPSGAGVGASANPSSPTSLVLVNDLNAAGTNLSAGAAYLYFAGPSPAAGFYSTTFEPSNDVRLSPETYVTIRNSTGSDVDTVVTGSVPVDVVGTTVVGVAGAAQDNQLVNPYPSGITLAGSGLTDVVEASPNPSSPLDLVLVYDNASTGTNISPTGAYLYFAGPSPSAGWYSTTFAPSDNVVIPAGGAFVVRKGAGNDETLTWNPPVPYAL